MNEHTQDPDIQRDEDRFVEPTPVPTGQEADQHHHRPQDPAEGPDLDDDSLDNDSDAETGSDDTLEQDRP